MNCLEEIKCPFYIYSPTVKRCRGMPIGKHIIQCEGAVNGMNIDVRFDSYDDYLKFKRFFCENLEHSAYCPYAEIAQLKYL